ncbi:hypothetical protein [Amycolatopsis thailandensis]|uniref:hypothetical protein n=1 Tax=Amycolatopsis thailandensis TaxID=589330 RepID=UPI00363E45D1
MKKFLACSALVAAALTAFAPSAAAAEWVSQGTFPSRAAAYQFCLAGFDRDAWDQCQYRDANKVTGTVELLTLTDR